MGRCLRAPDKPADGWVVRQSGPLWNAYHRPTGLAHWRPTWDEAVAATWQG